MKHFYNGTLVRLFYLRQSAGSSRVWTLSKLAAQIEETSSLSKGDVVHTVGILTTEIRKVLVCGDRVKIPELGTFFMTLSCKGAETKEELSVRNIEKVNIRFLPDKSLKLVNSALSSTRSDNNVSFAVKGSEADSDADFDAEDKEGDDVEMPEIPENPDGGVVDPNA
jgi:predicted histone-like DNA-binding protein